MRAPPCRGNRSSLIVVYLHFSDWSPADLRMVMMCIHCSVVFCMEKYRVGIISNKLEFVCSPPVELQQWVILMFVTCLRSRISFSSRPRLRSENPTIRNSGIPPNWPQPNENSKLQAIVNFFVLKNMFCRFWLFLSPSFKLRSNVFTVLDSWRATTRSVQEYDPAALCLKYLVQDQIFSLSHLSHF